MTSRSGGFEAPRRRVSQVSVSSFNGRPGAPKLTRLSAFRGGDDFARSISGDVARERFIAMHEDDVQLMMDFFKRAGLGMRRATACAEEAIYLDASSPRKLYKYVHEKTGFSLIHLGMDNIDAELVLEVLNSEFAASIISPEAAAKKAVDHLMRSSSKKKLSMQVEDYDEAHDECRL
jgi:hypothetical protein